MLKNQKGITLVALVITIIVLIILATVAISFAFGTNGIISRAEDAKEYSANDTYATDKYLNDATVYLDGYVANVEYVTTNGG